MDSVVLSVLEKVSKKHKIPLERLKELWSFNNKELYRVIDECSNPDAAIKEIKIPYIGTLNFNAKRYDKIKESVAKSKEGECESGHDLLGDNAVHREDNL